MLKHIFNRKNQIIIFFVIVFTLLGYRLYDLTIIQGAMYYDKSINNRIKQIETYAKRGDIYDRNGEILATSNVGFVLKLNSGVIPAESFTHLAINLYDFLESEDESHIEFPIIIDQGEFRYVYDDNIKKWKESNGYDLSMTASDIFKEVRSRNYLDTSLSDYEAFKILYNQGKYMPISTSKMKFLDEIYKGTFLKMYGIDENAPAEEAFAIIRSRNDFKIPKDMSDEDAYKILVFRHAIKEKGYYKYEPIVIAPSVKHETAVKIQEKGYEFPGTSISYESIRTYPNGSTAAHILGYMGKISSEAETEKYVTQNKYNPNQVIGKVGIEGNYELNLHGENGYKYIEVDVYGKYVEDIDEKAYGLESKKATSGDDLYLTVDLELQKTLEESLEKALKEIQKGGKFESPWGDYNYGEAFPQAETGAAVVVNVNTGEILAMASYPSYDINLFSTGISQEDWNSLNPVNTRNPLAARPLFNSATMMAIQPGSIYKMITGFAAMEQGLDPYQKLYDNGYVEIGNQRYACWLWNDYRAKHGLVDMIRALEVSCNYYFFDVATGKDFYKNKPLNYTITPQIIVDESKKFGLDEPTGIEIAESSFGIPDPDKKKRTIKILLSRHLKNIAKNYFEEDIVKDSEKLQAVIDEIVSWADENPSRGTLIKKLIELGSNSDYYVTENLADIIKYDYFNLMKWYEGDTFNLSIGQGDHTYTPVQMARYVATLANGGYLKELSVVKKVGNESIVKNQGEQVSFDTHGYIDVLQQGMLSAAKGSEGTARKIFGKFPIDVAAKTGTAEKEGLIPPLDEIQYLTEYLSAFAPGIALEDVEKRTVEIIKERSEELSKLEKAKNEEVDEAKKIEKEEKLNLLIARDYLNKGDAMRAAIKELSGDTLTNEDINQYRLPYDNYSWFATFAPYDNPEIAVVVVIPQGGHGAYGAPVARDVYAKYFNLTIPEEPEK
ncbi:penicillin-binding transpeptidase domain-containing protein [Fusibacter ferrireducens]|uniref:Penicillin-binding protein n=1 Tax=Fusibacter ferrireducens TaxID=2785058 RepID=A0ABR9ZWP2_9FIRM|nr:penicillin-binding transpeptidase domain-containing protein [Fusibacter ferrireducens]MBF4694868.1 hypothetical protein [Fusibacter ferrireducens]